MMDSIDRIKELADKKTSSKLELTKMIMDAARDRGLKLPVSLRELEMVEICDAYHNSIRSMQEKINYLISLEVKKMSEHFFTTEIEIPLLDYRIPFKITENEDRDYSEKQFLRICLRCLEGLTKKQGLEAVFSEIKKEEGFFNQREVCFINGAFAYNHIFNEIKRFLINLHLYTKSGSLTIVAKICQSEIKELLTKTDELNFRHEFDLRDVLQNITRRSVYNPNLETVLIEIGGKKRLKKNLDIIAGFNV